MSSTRLLPSTSMPALLGCVFFSMSASNLTAQTIDTASEVWSVVESYARAHAAKDLPLYLSFFHPEFSGWYYGDSTTTTREERETGLTHYFGAIDFLTYRTERRSITLFGDMAIVCYALHQRVRWSDGREEQWNEYWTDILIRDSKGLWRLRHDHGHRLE